MRPSILFILAVSLLLSCTKEIEKIIYQEPEHGKLVGVVLQQDSQAKVYVRQAVLIDSAVIDPQTGAFEIDNLSIGNYDVLILAPGYGTYKNREVAVNPGSVTYLGEISLPRLPDLIHSH